MFKVACISYQPSAVNYRANQLSRKKLLSMRRTLVDKCEEIINSHQWPHGNQDLRTGKIFRDLLQFYGTYDQSLYSEASGANEVTMPSQQASFMPAVSQRTLKQGSLDEGSRQDQSFDLGLLSGPPPGSGDRGDPRRKRSQPYRQHGASAYSPVVKVQGSGASLNPRTNKLSARGNNQTVPPSSHQPKPSLG